MSTSSSRLKSTKTDSSWAFFKYTPIKDIRGNGLYVKRLRVVETPWFGVYLHNILQPDMDREVHDHPWSFVSFLLKGSYLEERRKPGEEGTFRTVRFLNRMRHGDFHRIAELKSRSVWSLLFLGRRRSDWGFLGLDDVWYSHQEFFERHGYVEKD